VSSHPDSITDVVNPEPAAVLADDEDQGEEVRYGLEVGCPHGLLRRLYIGDEVRVVCLHCTQLLWTLCPHD
jgi:hypothetical protein